MWNRDSWKATTRSRFTLQRLPTTSCTMPITARDFLTVLADSMCTLGNVQMYVMGDTFVVLGPEHARILSQAGWRKRDVKMFLV